MLPGMSTHEQSYFGGNPQATTLYSPAGAGYRSRSAPRRLQLAALLTLAGGLNLWALSRNGWANTYYSAGGALDELELARLPVRRDGPGGVMTVDKPPLALWVQALSVRVFGYHPLSMLVPQALMGVASVALVYDLVGVASGGWAGSSPGWRWR